MLAAAVPFAVAAGLLATTAAAPPPSAQDRQLARAIFKELVELDTSQASGDSTRAAEAMARRLRDAGLPATDVVVLGPAGKRKGNLVARLRAAPLAGGAGTPARKPLLLLAHLDVVDARRSDWSVDPFTFLERDGHFYGRGTQDDKGLAALWVATALRLQREKVALGRDVILALTADEENGPDNGVQWLLAHQRALIDAELCLTEGAAGELKAGRRVSVDVQPSEKGYLTFTLEARSKGGHSALPEPDNAIVRLGEALARVHRHVFPVELTPVTRAYFTRMATRESGAVAADMRAVATPAGDPAAAARLSAVPFYNARLRTTCVPTEVAGGHAENALPQSARASINCRVLPGHDSDEIRRALLAAVADPSLELSVKHPLDAGPPSPLPDALLATIEGVTAAVWPGVPVVPIMQTGATDGRFLRAAGIPTYGLTGLFVDIADIRAHGRDERLLVRSFTEGQDFLYRLVTALAR